MIVGIDNITPGTSTSASRTLGSMRAYLQDLVDGLPAALPDWRFKLFTPAWNEPFDIRHSNLEVVPCPGASISRPRRVWFEQTALPRAIESEKVDIWLGTCNYLPLRTRVKKVLLVQSHQFFTNPEAFQWARRRFLQWIVPKSVRAADFTGVQSADAKKTLLRYIDVPEDSVSVVYNRLVDLDPSASADLPARLMGRARPYIVYISGFYPFKNHRKLIEAFARMRHAASDLALILAGGAAKGRTVRELRSAARYCGVADDVFFPGRISQAEAATLYRHARVSAIPSLEETFGMPVLEAMSMGCPVVTSNLSSMAELASDAAVLVDPRDSASIADGLREALLNEPLRETLIRRGLERCGYFTKERTIGAIVAALRHTAAQSA